MDTNVDIYSSTKKSWANIYHEPFETFAPSYQLDYAYAPMVAISSPGATGSTITTKKEATQTPTQEGIGQTQEDTTTKTGGDNTLLLLGVAGAVLIGLIYVWKKKKKK